MPSSCPGSKLRQPANQPALSSAAFHGLHAACRPPPLQAPARREATQAAYAAVASQFAAAMAAEAAAPRAAAATAPVTAAAATQPQAAADGDRVQLRLSSDASGGAVTVRLVPAGAAGAAARSISGPGTAGSADGQWRLQLVPSPGGDEVAVLLAPADVAAGASQQAQSSSGGSSGSAIPEASVQAAVGAARFMHHQLNELKQDVAAARLAMLKGALLSCMRARPALPSACVSCRQCAEH